MKNYYLFVLVVSTFLSISSHAQKDRIKVKFGEVTPEDFTPAAYSIDSNADGIYLYDAGDSRFEGNTKGNFNVVYTRHTRIRLLHKSSFDNLATIEIPIDQELHYEEKLESFDAAVYNIENGKVVVSKADRRNLLQEDAVKTKKGTEIVYKYTFPNLKEGSIIEFKYSINYPGDYYYPMVHPWEFQRGYPILYSEYTVTIPEFYDYVVLQHGLQPYFIDSAYETHDTYAIAWEQDNGLAATESGSVSANTIHSLWAMKDVPALKKEEYVSSLDNYRASLQFQLSALKFPDEPVRPVMNNWMKEASDLMTAEYFGVDLYRNNGWLNDDLKRLTSDASDELGKAKNIFEFVRDNFSCSNYEEWRLSQPLKKTFETKKGNVGDINLLLTAMLKNRGFDAQPAILSTRDNGRANEVYPIMDQYNYLICRVKIGDHYYLLDAANGELGFGHLSDDCYNGSARIIDSLPVLIPLSPDSLKESKQTSVFIINDSASMDAAYTSNLGYFESYDLREKIDKSNENDFFNAIRKGYSFNVALSDSSLDSLKKLDFPVSIKYNMHFNIGDDDIIYFNPMLTESFKDNPFKSANRFYPVEMPYCSDEIYTLNMEIPNGYTVDELPKSARVKLNDTDGMFEYLIAKSGNTIQMRCRLQLNKAIFGPDDYQTLRDFFGYVVKKEAEQIVFKKSN